MYVINRLTLVIDISFLKKKISYLVFAELRLKGKT